MFLKSGCGGDTYLAKFARFWMTLAMRVRVREVRSSGYSCIRLKRLGDIMAGHRNRRNSEALMSRSLMSCLPRFRHWCFHDANTSFNSRGKTLGKERRSKPLNIKAAQPKTHKQLHSGPTHLRSRARRLGGRSGESCLIRGWEVVEHSQKPRWRLESQGCKTRELV